MQRPEITYGNARDGDEGGGEQAFGNHRGRGRRDGRPHQLWICEALRRL
jgi:hypothetical protein